MASRYLCFILLVAYTRASPIELSPKADPEYRLPEDAVEVSYYNIELKLGTDIFDTNRFEGTTYVIFKNLKETHEVKIHANRITFQEVTLVAQDSTILNLVNEEFVADSTTDILTISSSDPLQPATNYQLIFKYTAELRTDSLNGLYKSSYTNADGKVRYLATTQFQPTHARKVFPCFDEPSYKATFDMKIRHPTEYSALSNTAGISRVDPTDSDYTNTIFATTPKMSTYLIAYIISDFTCTDSEDIIEGIPHAVCSREQSAPTRQVAVDVGPKMVRAMGNFTGVSFELHKIGKIHQVAIPDFSAGAMENWGLVTYRETALLWDAVHSSNRYKQRVETVIAHELAHYWFGDLVTCNWWSDTFLNEGWATYFEYLLTAEIEPTWELEKQFVIEELQPALVSDASRSSAALSASASSPSQISGRFGTISYSKGGAIFRMVQYIVGIDNFKAALNKYLMENQFGYTYPKDLWNAFQSFAPTNLPSDKTINDVMENWVVKAGYPVLQVTASGQTVTITQKRFLSSGTPSDDEKWYVPISYTTSSDSNKFEDATPRSWLTPDTASLNIALQNNNDWIILNNQQTSYYRIDYDDQLWERIAQALNKPGFDGIHEINRAQLVDDLYIFTRYGYRSFKDLLQFLQFLKKDTSYFSWYAAFNAFSTMNQRTGDAELRASLSAYILELIEIVYNSIPFSDAREDDQIYTHKKVLIIPWACRLGLQNCIDSSVSAFTSYKNSGIKPDKNMRSVIYCNGLRHSTDIQNDWNFLWNEFTNTDLATEQVTLISALGCATDETVLKNYLRKSIDPNSGIRQQDAASVFSAVYGGNPEGVDVAFDFLVENFEEISTSSQIMSSISSILSALGNRFTRQDQTDKLQNFINSGKFGNYQSAATSALNTALTNLNWISKFEEEMKLFFSPDEGEVTGPSTNSPPTNPSSDPTTETPDGDNNTAAPLSVGLLTIIATLLVSCYHFVL